MSALSSIDYQRPSPSPNPNATRHHVIPDSKPAVKCNNYILIPLKLNRYNCPAHFRLCSRQADRTSQPNLPPDSLHCSPKPAFQPGNKPALHVFDVAQTHSSQYDSIITSQPKSQSPIKQVKRTVTLLSQNATSSLPH
jgi:hypothetical protein